MATVLTALLPRSTITVLVLLTITIMLIVMIMIMIMPQVMWELPRQLIQLPRKLIKIAAVAPQVKIAVAMKVYLTMIH